LDAFLEGGYGTKGGKEGRCGFGECGTVWFGERGQAMTEKGEQGG